jgi:sarcosine oxidase subunit beta
MADTADAVVVGGGVNGASIAHALVVRGVRVTLVEKGAMASGASGRSSALIRMHYTNEWDSRLAWASYPVFRDWPERVGGPPVFTRTGFLNLVGPEHADHLRRNVEMLRGIGVPTVALDPGELKALQPFMHVEDVGAAAYEPESGYASPADVVEGFRRRIREQGGRILEGTAVGRIRVEGSRVTGVETSAGPIGAPVVVVGAGAWAVPLCRGVGLALPARTKAIDTVLVTRPPELAAPHMTVIDAVQSTYFRPESGILTIVGIPNLDYDVDPDRMGTGLPPAAAPAGAELLAHRIPAMERATLARGFRAFDLYSHDRHAILDRADGPDGLYVATAFSGSGFKISPAVGTCMAELILDGAARTVDIRPFGLRRFAEGRPLEGPHPYTRTERGAVPGVVV